MMCWNFDLRVCVSCLVCWTLECHGGRGGKEGGARHQVQRGGAGSLELEIGIAILQLSVDARADFGKQMLASSI